MKSAFSRRSLLAGAGYAVAAGSVSGSLLSVVRAAEEQGESAICLSMLYGNSPKAKFDAKEFRQTHLPLLKSAYGSTLERVELRVPGKPRGMPGSSLGAGSSNMPSAAAPMGPPARVLGAV